MKEQGFTLVELIAVIVILGLLALVAVPAVTGVIKNSKEDLSETQKNNIILGAKDWASDIDNYKKLPKNNNGYICVSLETLQNSGHVDLDIVDPKKSKGYEEAFVKIQRVGNNLEYTFQDNKTSYEEGKCISEKLNETN